jgi:tetratricopeptide (TPR) repeat protein
MNSTVGRAGLVFALSCLLYSGALRQAFHYDDFHSIAFNPHIRSLENLARFFWDPTTFSVDPQQAMYRPVLLVSYALNHALGGLQPAGYHLVNVLLHGANAVLVLLWVQALSGRRGLALATAAFFAATPLNAETVNYASSRSEALMGLFFLGACLAHARFGRTGKPGWYSLSLSCGILALLTKAVAVVLVAALALAHGYREGWKEVHRHWRQYLPFAAVGLLYVLFTRSLVGKAMLAPVRPLDAQAWTQVKAALYYLYLGAVPVRLSVEHQFFVSPSPLEPAVLGAGLVLLSLGWLLARSGQRLLVLTGAWAVVLLLPTAAVPLIALVNEHRLYLASLGLGLLMAWALLNEAGPGKRVAFGLAAVYTIILAGLALERTQVWRDELSLWQDAAQKAPLMLKPHLRLADALAAAGRLEEAEAAYWRALALRPHHPAARNNLGELYKRLGRLEEAQAQFRTLLESSPDATAARLNLAGLLLRSGQWQEAEAQYQRALQFEDTGGEAQHKLGHIALSFRSDPRLALAHFEAALEKAPMPRADVWTGRGVALRSLGRYEEAEAAYHKALEIDPARADAWFNLGNLYRDGGRTQEAEAAYEQVVKLGDSTLAALAAQQLKALQP